MTFLPRMHWLDGCWNIVAKQPIESSRRTHLWSSSLGIVLMRTHVSTTIPLGTSWIETVGIVCWCFTQLVKPYLQHLLRLPSFRNLRVSGAQPLSTLCDVFLLQFTLIFFESMWQTLATNMTPCIYIYIRTAGLPQHQRRRRHYSGIRRWSFSGLHGVQKLPKT